MTNEGKKSEFQKRLENLQVEAYRRNQGAKEMEMEMADMGLGFVKMKKERIYIKSRPKK
ncbi:hypothetical protein WJ0W_006042 [Paenibacillus melissococcoides]|uniref:Uncharacterized protein n=1 Tax=Paenibacillus melissococcoides TaxID=2912268 RepID=A0ABM9G0M8_9BACL|nr:MULTISPECIES: hypothetical protein [Paenibacillus]CAH8242827.1 hypothetical protein WJ0W_000010 [Paenibacillus melissococcoides]CAH8245138.1 hypothetical protein WJ0W_002368 [Paenibacillus melissococcoides]CAH8248858.1 hypothetical protein WJ0W_006042 [Paenibacillus melissococcoides]CAH8703219.1 hypothetical protein WDD9_000011 [Paenibacillus melissococcoides]CAH8705984.1 hypothetical protein HTL2_001093 [Paenibacillus melissococcoides]